MDEHAYSVIIEALSSSYRLVFDALATLGCATDDAVSEAVGRSRSQVIPRRTGLVRMGLVRECGHATSKAGRQTKLWEIVPREVVEQAKEQARGKGLRRLSVKRWPSGEKLAVVRELLREPTVYDALMREEGPGARR